MIIVFIFYICVCLDESEFRILQGCLSLGDGSKYDGMWRYGKKSGLGTFYFNNGDIYRGSWRDDLMHGKVPIFLHWALMVMYKFIIQILVWRALLPHAINFLFFVSLSFWKLWHFNTPWMQVRHLFQIYKRAREVASLDCLKKKKKKRNLRAFEEFENSFCRF